MAGLNPHRSIVSLTLLAVVICVQGGACLPRTTPDEGKGNRAGETVRKTIGSEGGVIEAINSRGDTIRLEIPSGALSGSVDISVDPLDEPPANPIGENVFPGVDLAPDGLMLLKAATLKVSPAEGTVDARALLFHLRQADFVVPISEQEVNGGVISGKIRHFSSYLGGSPSGNEASQQAGQAAGQSQGSSHWQSTLDDVGGLLQWGEWFQSQGMESEAQDSFKEAEERLREAIECFLDPGCHVVPIDICDDDYVREALAYLGQAQLLGFDEESELMQDLHTAVTHLLNQCTNRFAIEYDYLQTVDYASFSHDIHVTGQVLFSLPIYVVGDIGALQATGQGTVNGTITGAADECTITGSFTINVVVEGELEADEMGQPWLNLRLNESWYASGQQTVVCPDESSDLPLFPVQSVQNVRLLMQDGYVLEQPHLETQGHYRWTLHVLHLW